LSLLSLQTPGLFCEAGGFHIDPMRAVDTAIITHAHSDHARSGSRAYFCAPTSAGLLRARLGPRAQVTPLPYGERRRFGAVTVSLHPAGHILGSAQVRMEHEGRVWVVSGDYKRDDDPSCEPFEPVPCDVFVTEATFGLPVYQWKPAREVAAEIAAWWEESRASGSNCLLFCYSLGKAQRVLAELAPHAAAPILVHSTIPPLNACYEEAGIRLAPTRLLPDGDGDELRGQLILAPPSILNTGLARRLGRYQTGFASGWMQLGSHRRRRGYDRCFVLSDHADWPALVRTVRETGARRVYVMHGRNGILARYLREQGLDAHPVEALGETGARERGRAGAGAAAPQADPQLSFADQLGSPA
jgi:putative mRNA 3-end processing factor